MGPAVVLGQDLAEAAWPVRDGAAADLAAGNRKMGNSHREAVGTGPAHHLHDARPDRLSLRAPCGSAAALDRSGPAVRNRNAVTPVSSAQIALISTHSQRHVRRLLRIAETRVLVGNAVGSACTFRATLVHAVVVVHMKDTSFAR